MHLTLNPICDQLRLAGMRNVDGVLEFARQASEPRALPAYFVVPISETAAASVNVGGRDQLVDCGFSVMVVLDATGRDRDAISDKLAEETDRVKGALVGWTHPQATRACDYAGGRLASAAGSTLVWEVRLRAAYHERKER